MNSNTGILYISVGNEFLEEAKQSALSVKLNSPGIPCALLSNKEYQLENSPFDMVIINHTDSFSWRYKAEGLLSSPFENTLYLDSDTFVCGDLHSIFFLGTRVDLALAHAPLRISSADSESLMSLPDCFPELNTGVIFYKKSDDVKKLYLRWMKLMENVNFATSGKHDQPYFRQALFEVPIKFSVLTPEYNCRFIRAGFLNKEVKILHGRALNIKNIAVSLNQTKTHRIHILEKGRYLKIYELKDAIPSSKICEIET